MNDYRKDGGPAFAGGVMPHPTDPNKVTPIAQLTVRDWFAGQALAACYSGNLSLKISREDLIEDARAFYMIADAMMESRK